MIAASAWKDGPVHASGTVVPGAARLGLSDLDLQAPGRHFCKFCALCCQITIERRRSPGPLAAFSASIDSSGAQQRNQVVQPLAGSTTTSAGCGPERTAVQGSDGRCDAGQPLVDPAASGAEGAHSPQLPRQ
jgi:hypothetical protein